MNTTRTKFIDEGLYFISSYVERSTFEGGNHDGSKHRLLKHLAALREGKNHGSINALTKLVRETQSPAAYLALAGAQLCARAFDSAIITLDVLLYQQPELPEAELMKGIVHLEAGDPAEARALIHKAVESKPMLWSGWKLLIELALQRGDRADAQQLISEALWHDPRRTDLPGLPITPEPRPTHHRHHIHTPFHAEVPA